MVKTVEIKNGAVFDYSFRLTDDPKRKKKVGDLQFDLIVDGVTYFPLSVKLKEGETKLDLTRLFEPDYVVSVRYWDHTATK